MKRKLWFCFVNIFRSLCCKTSKIFLLDMKTISRNVYHFLFYNVSYYSPLTLDSEHVCWLILITCICHHMVHVPPLAYLYICDFQSGFEFHRLCSSFINSSYSHRSRHVQWYLPSFLGILFSHFSANKKKI